MLDKAYHNEDVTERMISSLQRVEKPSALEKAYLGAAQLIMADHASMPWTKYSYFNKGSALLDQAADEDATSAEIRYLRFACQTNMPEFLGYNKSIEADKSILLRNVSHTSDRDLAMRIKKILLSSRHMSEQEKKKLEQS